MARTCATRSRPSTTAVRCAAGRSSTSGNATFASDGDVNANIMGSGNVTVKGRARCKVKTMGSGSLVCEDGAEEVGKAA